MKKLITVLVVFILIAASVFGYYSIEYAKKIKPNDEIISQTELFNVSGDRVAIMYNDSLLETTGLYRDNQIYLPLNWIKEYLNDKFYWDSSQDKLIYTLPTEILYSTLETRGEQGAPLLLKSGEEIYLSLSLVNTYCDAECNSFTGGDAQRVFINDNWKIYETAALDDTTVLRTGRSIKQRGIVSLAEGERVRILRDYESEPEEGEEATEEPWCRVRTDDGFTGYLPKAHLTNYDTVQPASTYVAPVYEHITLNSPIVLGWHQTTNQTANENLTAILEKDTSLNVLAPTWFSLSDNDGNVTSLVNDNYITRAHENGIQVWALVDNFDENVNTETILKNAEARAAVIHFVVEESLAHDIDGINIDFEKLPESSGEAFIQFIRELSVSCRNNRLVLSVDNPNPALYNLFYNRSAQAECVDYVINMGYDEHYVGSEAGSVSSYPFFRDGIDLSLQEVPAERLIAGIPFYTRIWTGEGDTLTSTAIGLDTAKQWAEENNVSLTWDNELGQYTGATENERLWLEDNESLELKMNYITSSGLGGVACWKLGLEGKDTWEIVHF